MLVTLPLVLLLLDYWPLGRLGGQQSEVGSRLRRLIAEKVPLFALSACSCIATLFAQKQSPGAIDQLPFLWRLNNTFVGYITYIWQMLWPARLAVFYPHPNGRLPLVEVTVAIAFLVGVSLLVIYLRRTKPYLVTGWFWYLGMLVPVIGLVQVGEQAHADRYTYLPQIGLYIMKYLEQRNANQNARHDVIAVPPKRNTRDQQHQFHRTGPLSAAPHPNKICQKQR